MALLPWVASAVCADQPAIRTNRSTPQILPLPKSDDAFHFVIFGDRTGGPPEGVQVLAQAVRDTNLLDPDLVMTVGDLVQGYNGRDLWETQMREYKGTMERLRMPWFPVAGNHDIYWRGEGRPPTEHEADYETHFGPLWYWFEHKECGFLVLHSDEGDPASPAVPRDFGQPAQQKFSEAQLEWLRDALAEMKPLRHVFVFMHHPRWAPDIYPGSNWDKVHALMREAGNVRACFAGHIHRLRHDGVKDGIEYMALAATGGSIPGDFPGVGYLHHFNVVTVRPDGIKVATVPVGAVIDPRRFTPERTADLDRARRTVPTLASPPITVTADGLGAGVYEISLANPSRRPVEFTLSVEADPGEWIITPDHQHIQVEAGRDHTFRFTYVRVRSAFEAPVQAPVFELDTDYLEESARTTLPPRRFPAQVRLGSLPPEAYLPAARDTALKLSGEKSGAKIDASQFGVPDGPFTLEAWVCPNTTQPTAGLAAKTQQSEFGLLAENGVPHFLVHLGGRYVSANGTAPLAPNTWSHVAGVFDGQSVSLFVNGERVAQAAGSGARQRNDLPLFLGADPDQQGNPTRAFDGWIDEVRLSAGARYSGSFTPVRRHAPDEAALLLFHFDRLIGDFLPDQGTARAHARLTGAATLDAAPPAGRQ